MLWHWERENAEGVLNTGLPLDMIGNIEADWSDVMKRATKFTATCYGQSKATSMSEARPGVGTARIGKPVMTRAPKLSSLPLTTQAFFENVKRAHLQTFLWKNTLQLRPRNLDATEY